MAGDWQADRDRLLREAGFVDLETAEGELPPIIREKGQIDRDRLERGYYRDLEEYYRLAGQWLHEHPFRNDTERRIWELHAEGASVTRIFRVLRAMDQRVYRKLVEVVIVRVRSTMLGQERRRRGRPVESESLRSEGMAINLRLTRDAALALDYTRTHMRVSASEAIRRALILVARELR